MSKPVHKQTPEEFQRRINEIHGAPPVGVPEDVATLRKVVFELQEAALCSDDDDEANAWQHIEKARTIARDYLDRVEPSTEF